MGYGRPRSLPRPGRSPVWSRVTPATPLAFLQRSMGGVRPTLRPPGQPIGPAGRAPSKAWPRLRPRGEASPGPRGRNALRCRRGRTTPASESTRSTERPTGPQSVALLIRAIDVFTVRVAAPQQSSRIFLAGEMTDCCGAGTAAPQGSVAHRPRYQGPHSGSPRCSCRDPVGTAPSRWPEYASPWPQHGSYRPSTAWQPERRRRATWCAVASSRHSCPGSCTPSCLAGNWTSRRPSCECCWYWAAWVIGAA
jgi:hypothetical protein